VKGRWRDKITGRTILLFDDVLTTGATASTCARMLYREGARNVDVLTLGRALMEPGDVYF
jgi:predicted amidophosphoribosyltransferase